MDKNGRKVWEKFRRHDWYIKVAALFIVMLILGSLIIIIECLVTKDVQKADILAVFLNTLVAGLGFFAIYASIQNDKEIKQFEFFADYNFNFLTNKGFIDVERKLEACNQEYMIIDQKCGQVWSENEEKCFKSFCDSVFGTKNYEYSDIKGEGNSRRDENNLISVDYQNIVNYLVYLESFVPLILNKQLYLEDVDDLFGYRYFIAMHNPVLQENELFRERSYYRGCFKVYKMWKDHRNKDELGCVIPMERFDLMDGWNKYVEKHKEAKK